MAVTALAHVLVLSDDIDASRDFYRDIVGMREGPRPPLEFPGYWLYADGEQVACMHIADRVAYLTHAATLGLGTGPDDGTGQRAGTGAPTVDHIAFDAPDYESAIATIERHGLDYVRNTVPGGPRQLFILDPNGVRVEINVSGG